MLFQALRSRWREGEGYSISSTTSDSSSIAFTPKSLSCLVKSRKAAGVNTNGIPRRDPLPLLFSKLPLSSGAHSLFRRYARHRLLEGTSRLNPSRVVRRHFFTPWERIINRLQRKEFPSSAFSTSVYGNSEFWILVMIHRDLYNIAKKFLMAKNSGEEISLPVSRRFALCNRFTPLPKEDPRIWWNLMPGKQGSPRRERDDRVYKLWIFKQLELVGVGGGGSLDVARNDIFLSQAQ